MANWGQKVYPSDYSEIKALLKAEIGRRGKTEGTARGQSVGSMASYNGSAYDFSTQPKAGAYIKNEHIQKITKPLDAIKGTSTTPGNGVQITASRLSQAAAVLSELSAIPETLHQAGVLAAVQAYVLRDAIRLARAVQAPVLGAAQGLAWHRAPMIALADAREAARERARGPAREPALELVQITAPALARGPVRGPARVRVRERAQRRVRMIAPALARGPVREAVREAALEVAPEAVTQLARRIAQITVLVSAPADVRAAALVRVMGALRLVRAAVEAAVLIIAQVNVSSNAVRRVRMTAPAAV